MSSNAALNRPQGNRYGNRLRLGVPAGLVMTYRTRRCLLDDISSTGARIRVEEPLVRGRIVMLQFHELRLCCSVIWCRNGECGLRFDKKLAQEDMKGFLWILQHPKAYRRICQESGVRDWSAGIGS